MTTNKIFLARPVKILWAGRMSWDKNVQTLIRAVSLCPPWFYLYLVGDGKMKKPLEKLAVSLGVEDRVFFLGKVPHEQMHNYFVKCDVYCQPSLFLDALPRTVIEASVAGKHSIVSDRCGLLGCETVLPPLDVDAWKNALLEVSECSGWVVPERQRVLVGDSFKVSWGKRLLCLFVGKESAGIN